MIKQPFEPQPKTAHENIAESCLLAHAPSSKMTTTTVRQLEGLDHRSNRNKKLHRRISPKSKLQETSHPTAYPGGFRMAVVTRIGACAYWGTAYQIRRRSCSPHGGGDTRARDASPRVLPGAEVTRPHRCRASLTKILGRGLYDKRGVYDDPSYDDPSYDD